MSEDTPIDVPELLAIIGERVVIARKHEQKIRELEARIRELEALVKQNGKLD